MNKPELEQALAEANEMVEALKEHCQELHTQYDVLAMEDHRKMRMIEVLLHTSLEVFAPDGTLVSQYVYMEGDDDASPDATDG